MSESIRRDHFVCHVVDRSNIERIGSDVVPGDQTHIIYYMNICHLSGTRVLTTKPGHIRKKLISD